MLEPSCSDSSLGVPLYFYNFVYFLLTLYLFSEKGEKRIFYRDIKFNVDGNLQEKKKSWDM